MQSKITGLLSSVRLTFCSKYGNVHRQLRALVILDDLVQNAGPSFQRTFADEMLLERLRILVTDPVTDVEVREKCQALYRQWAFSYKNTPGMEGVASLYKQLPQRKRPRNAQDSKAVRETERMDDDEEEAHQRKASIAAEQSAVAGRRRSSVAESHSASSSIQFAPTSSSSQRGGGTAVPASHQKGPKERRGSKSKIRPFNFEKERPQINHVISMANIESTGLINTLKHMDKEKERVSDNAEAKRRFETCKQLRKQTFRYCNFVTDESYLATLLNANDQLMEVLMLYEQLDRAFDYDSDSEDYGDDAPSAAPPPPQQRMAGLSIREPAPPSMPPRPVFREPLPAASLVKDERKAKAREEQEEDEDDPFADRNAIPTPRFERGGMTW
jgi:LAS seventeen-binding protein 5